MLVFKYDETVHVETLDEYRAVLEKWFAKGYDWYKARNPHRSHEEYFIQEGVRYLVLLGDKIQHSTGASIDTTEAVSFKEFMAEEKEVTYSSISIGGIPEREHGKVTYEVSEEQMAFLRRARENQYPATYLIWFSDKYRALFSGYEYTEEFERDLLKYVSGDENVVFQVKGPLYLLKGKDSDGDTVYFRLNTLGAPTYVYEDHKSDAFKAPHEEILRWETPFWKVEPVDA